MKYAKALNVSPLYIMGYDQDYEDRKKGARKYSEILGNMSQSHTTVKIPVFSYVSAGTGTYADESNIDCYIDISEDLAKTGDYFGVRVKGDSMQPDIHDQDIVVARSQNTANDGDTVIAVVNGDEGFCKKLMVYPNSISLVSNNPAYRPMIFSQKEVEEIPVRIMGVVVELRRSFSR
jgi:repressor LexA